MKTKLLLLFCLVAPLIVFAQQNKVWVPYRDGDRWGYSDTLGTIKVKPVYDSAGFFEGTVAFVYKGTKAGMINYAGIELIKPDYTVIEGLEEGYKVYQDDKAGYISASGKLILPVQYKDMYILDEKFMIVQQGNKFGITDMTGKILLPVAYDEVVPEFLSTKLNDDNYVIVKKEGQAFSFDKKTHKLEKFNGVLEEMKEGIAELESIPPPMEEIDQSAKYLKEVKAKFKADEVSLFNAIANYASQVFFLVTVDGKKGVVEYVSSTDIRTIVPIAFDAITYTFTNDLASFAKPGSRLLAAVSKNGKFGVVNESGAVIIPFEYSKIDRLTGYPFGFELQNEKKKGVFLPTTMYPIIPPKYDAVEYVTTLPVNDNWAFVIYRVELNGKYAYIGENGKEYFK